MTSRTYSHSASTIVTMQLGVCLTVLLGLMFFSGGQFYLYTFNYDVGPYFTITRFIHFYAGLASIPFLLAKYGSTGYRFAGYYLRLPRFKKGGAPTLIPRIFSPLLALDFFVLYFSGLYMLFHYYYTVTNIPPYDFKPVQVHLWASILAVPLIAIHLGSHLIEVAQGLYKERRELLAQVAPEPETTRRIMTRRAFMGTVVGGGLGLALAFQNTPLANKEFKGLFIGRIPGEEKGGSGDFPVETLFGKKTVDVASWRLKIDGAVGSELNLTYDELLALPTVTKTIRISCVSGWTSEPKWSGPLVRDVLAKASADLAAKTVYFNSVSGYSLGWHRHRVVGDNAILATHVNGAPLSDNHGFPVRLIVPGYPGQNMVKQIDHIYVGKDEQKNDPDFHLTSLEGSDSPCATTVGREV
jgi:hypothetical protein